MEKDDGCEDTPQRALSEHALLERIERLERLIDDQASRIFYNELENLDRVNLATLETPQDRYVRSTTDGWLQVMINGRRNSLPSGLLVSLIRTASGRDYGVVKEGALAGVAFDVSSGNLVATYGRFTDLRLKVITRAAGPVTVNGVSYDLELRIQYRDGATTRTSGPHLAFTQRSNPVPTGIHDLEIADHPHEGGQGYGATATVWFLIGHTGDRYLHPGTISLGCMTCLPASWDEIHRIVHSAPIAPRYEIGRKA